MTRHVLPCRIAFELPSATCYNSAVSRPIFRELGEITFKNAVEVGDLLRLHSTVLHTHEEPSTGQVSSSIILPGRMHWCPCMIDMLKLHLCTCSATIPALFACNKQSIVKAAPERPLQV